MKELSFLFSLGYEALRTFEKLRLKQPLGQIGIYSVFKILQTANNEEKPGRYKTQVTGNRPLFYQYGKYPKHL